MGENPSHKRSGVFHNLLKDQVIGIRTAAQQTRQVTLPELLALMMADEVESLSALRPHQKQALHCFLAQIGAMALLAAGVTEPPHDADQWAELLRGLTPRSENDEPWCLVVDDWEKPAFMQAPVPVSSTLDFSKDIRTADEFDLLVTSRNHDVKAKRMQESRLEHWTFSLITNQTFQGGNSGSYRGISRMNGDYGSRPFVGVGASPNSFGLHLRRDIRILVKTWDERSANSELHAAEGGMRLLWLEPWDGIEALETKQLHPYYVELCRRVRLVRHNSALSAKTATNKLRINQPKGKHQSKDFTLPTGDPWTPVEKDSGKPLTLDASGFHYRRVVNLLDPGKFNPAPLQMLFDADGRGGAQIIFAAIVRGQGETQGYHERRIHVPERLKPAFMRKSALGDVPSDLARVARDRVDDVAKVASKALRPALFALYQAAPEKLDFQDPKAKTKAQIFLDQFDRAVDEDFFERLFKEVDEQAGSDPAKACRKEWIENCLWARARDALAAAETGSPLKNH